VGGKFSLLHENARMARRAWKRPGKYHEMYCTRRDVYSMSSPTVQGKQMEA